MLSLEPSAFFMDHYTSFHYIHQPMAGDRTKRRSTRNHTDMDMFFMMFDGRTT